jgi:hypothetical protein
VQAAKPVAHAAAPLLALELRIENGDDTEIRNVALQCQIRIEAARRRYEPEEEPKLLDLFGEKERWGQTLRSMLWTHTSANVGSFRRSTTVDLPVPCTFDFNVAATKYFHALEGGEVPLTLLFSGTIFYDHEQYGLQVAQIPWEKEARYRMPVAVWKQVIDAYYPNSAWLTLRRDVFDRLHEFKMRHGIATWEQAFERLLAEVEERALV